MRQSRIGYLTSVVVGILFLAGCAHPSSKQPPPRPEMPIEPRVAIERRSAPAELPPDKAMSVALRALVQSGFDITLKDREAGVLRATRRYVDRLETNALEKERIDTLEELGPSAYPLVRGTELDTRHTVTRQLQLSIVLTDVEVSIQPAAEVCIQALDVRCAPQSSLTKAENEFVDQVFFLLAPRMRKVMERVGPLEPTKTPPPPPPSPPRKVLKPTQ